MYTRPTPLLLLACALLPACVAEGETPSLAPRPMEYELSGRPVPPCLRTAADTAPTAPVEAAAAPDAELGARVEALLSAARQGQADFAALLPAAQRSAARAGAAGSESWIAAQQDISRLEAARARTADALAELDALILARSNQATHPEDLERLTKAAEEVRALAETQSAELNRIAAALSGPSALLNAPSPAPHNGQRPPAGRQALAASGPAHILRAALPKAAPTGSACRG